MRLQGKVALVTGGGTGLGRAIALRFAEEGARVVVTDINAETAQKTAQAIGAQGGECLALAGDTSAERDVEQAVARTVEKFGALDILVNCAGIETWQPTHETTVEDWDRVMAVNLRGVFLMSKHAVRAMLSQARGGAIVNLSSSAGLVGLPLLGAYTASKHGVVGLTKTMALELRDQGIRVNAICPSFIGTDMVLERSLPLLRERGIPIDAILAEKQGRLGEPIEVANLALFLASDEASFVNGAALPIDNGNTAQ